MELYVSACKLLLNVYICVRFQLTVDYKGHCHCAVSAKFRAWQSVPMYLHLIHTGSSELITLPLLSLKPVLD